MRTYQQGRHEHGRNYLIDRAVIAALTQLVADSPGPIVEIGPGGGALTGRLSALGRPVTAVEIDGAAAAALRRTAGPGVDVVQADFLKWPLPDTARVVAGNVPFHLTTAILRRLLHAPGWTRAVLLVQWEVARRRAGVGGATMMTAQWWPWFDFRLAGRVSRHALRPVPAVDGGLLVMDRRPHPLLGDQARDGYRRFVHAVFTAKGSGLAGVLATVARTRDRRLISGWTDAAGIRATDLPRDLAPEQWVLLFTAVTGARGRGPVPARG